MSTHLPRLIPRPLHCQCLFHHHRAFSSLLPRAAHMPAMQDPARMRNAIDKNAHKAEGIGTTRPSPELASDLGVFPGTFIRLRWRKLPSLIFEPKKRLRYEWKGAKRKFVDMYMRLYYKFWLRKGRPRPQLENRKIAPLAKEKHEQLYTALAANDDKTLSNLCLTTLLSHLRTHTSSRPPNTTVTWKILRYLSKPRLVSNNAQSLAIPDYPSTAFRQAVVRIHTRQLLTTTEHPQFSGPGSAKQTTVKWSPDGSHFESLAESEGSEEKSDTTLYEPKVTKSEKDMMEYIILQKRMVKGVEEDNWKVLSFAEETTLEKIAADEKYLEDIANWQKDNPAEAA